MLTMAHAQFISETGTTWFSHVISSVDSIKRRVITIQSY